MPDYSSQDYLTSGVDIDTCIGNIYGYNLPMKSPRRRHQEEEYAVGYEFDQYENEFEDDNDEDCDNEVSDEDLGLEIENQSGWDDDEDVIF